MKRREILKRLSIAPIAGGVIAAGITSASAATESVASKVASRDLFKELGLRTFINAAGNYTVMTGSLMPEEAVAAIQSTAKEYVMLNEVHDAVGKKIAAMCHAEAAMVTAGCWSALVLGTAGVLTGKDPKKISALPKLEGTGMKSEIIVQKTHINGYHHALTNTGATLITIETAEEAEAAINSKTAMMWFLNREAPVGKIQHQQWLDIAKKHSLPTFIDIAADVPPVENLWKFNEMGFDMVCISGGKAMSGPQSAGILMGKKELIEAARLNGPPNGGNIGRGHKVNKEEMFAMYVALEVYVNKDHAKEWKLWESKVALIRNAIKDVAGVKAEQVIGVVANQMPSLEVTWDVSKIKLSGKALGEKLRVGSPSIVVIDWEKENGVRVSVTILKPGQDKLVASRLQEELKKASA